MSEIVLEVRELTKRYGHTVALDGVSFEIRRGETLVLLGPSGCGKSTTLKIISGLELPDGGEVSIFGETVVSISRNAFVPAEKRNLGLVFQSYAIWPHMTVEQNVSYPLEVRRVPKRDAAKQVDEILEVVGLAGYQKRSATQLSGGQQQRVALARALVYHPSLLLLDEPLSNLDARLRDELRAELRRIQRQMNLTVLYVTHDQVEALTLADHVAVMHQGRIEQLGTPLSVYDTPRTLFVQNFLGKACLFEATVKQAHNPVQLELDVGPVLTLSTERHLHVDARVYVSFRAEDVSLGVEPTPDELCLPAVVVERRFLGSKLEYVVRVGQQDLVLESSRFVTVDAGDNIDLRIPRERIRIWEKDGLSAIDANDPRAGPNLISNPPKDGAPNEPKAKSANGEPSGRQRKFFTNHKANVFGMTIVLVVALFTLLPVAFVVVGSFNAAAPGSAWRWGLRAWEQLFASTRTLDAVGYSLLLTIRVPIAVLIGFLVAWLLVRVQIPGKSFIEFSLWLSYFLPSLPVAIGWILLLHKDYGLVNRALMMLPFVKGPVFDIYSVSGILWVHLTLTTIPVMMILLAPALRQLDASLEQSAKVCGSGNLRTLRRILVPILAPALLTSLLAGFIRGLEAFEIEQLLGIPAGIYVYATRVYDLVTFEPPQFPQAMALSTLLLTFLSLLAFIYQLYSERTRYVTLSGRGVSFAPLRVGRWRYLASAACIGYIGFAIFLPLGLLLLASFMRLFGFFSIAEPLTLKQWGRVLGDPAFLLALRNSVVLALSVSTIGLLLYGLIAYAIARSRLAGKRALSLLVWLPWSVPGILLGMSLLWLMLTLPVVNLLYGTMGALVLALVIQSMPIGTQMLRTSFGQVGDELEQASTVSGAGWLMTYRRIMLPLIAPMLVSIFVLTFISSLRDISTTILLAGSRTRPLSLLMMEFATAGTLEPAAAIGVILSAIAIVVALVARRLGLRVLSESS
jgi:iron(III) transport system permease protein